MKRQHKYRAIKTTVDGITFASKAEAKRYSELKLMQRAGAIINLKLQPKFRLQTGYTNGAGTKIRPIDYVADFMYEENGKVIIEDVKGMKTPVYNLKKKIFENKYYPLTITEI